MAIKTFTAGSVLTASDTNTYLANSGLVYITSVSFNAQNTLITNCFSSTYDHYRIIYTSTASSVASPQGVYFRPNDINAGYGGSLVRSYGTTVNALANASDLFYLGNVSSSSHQWTCQADLMNPYLAVPKYCNFQAFAFDGTNNVNYAGGENLYNTTQCTNLRVGVFTGTINATVTIYGYRKA